MVQFDKGFTKKEREKMKEILKGTYCYYSEKKKCSINCDSLHICDYCYDENELTPFCLWNFKDIIYRKEIIRDIAGDTVCKNHGHKEIKENINK